jgi:hypothetical protein
MPYFYNNKKKQLGSSGILAETAELGGWLLTSAM